MNKVIANVLNRTTMSFKDRQLLLNEFNKLDNRIKILEEKNNNIIVEDDTIEDDNIIVEEE